jgi:hypothetical protein
MNIIVLIIIFAIIIYLIHNKKTNENITNTPNINDKTIENITNIPTINYIDINNSIPTYSNFKNDNNTLSLKSTSKDNVPKKIYHDNHKYNLIGTAINKFYNQEYKLYESKVKQCDHLLMRENLNNLDDQIYNYIFVIFDDNKAIIQKEFGPRNKIYLGDIIYLDISFGRSYIGPYIII